MTDTRTEDSPGTTRTEAPAIIEGTGLSKVFGLPPERARALLDGERAAGAVSAAGGNTAVHDVSFTVERGELFVVMGLSGSGKSTLLRMVNRLVEPTSGTLRIDGEDLAGMDPGALRDLRNRQISMVFQHFALLPHRTVRENAAYGLHIRGVPRAERLERADAALRTVGLGDRGDARPDQLSGGMRQRVGLARALATDADVLLMDEPFSALDPLIRRDMQDLLLDLQAERRRTIVFVTHDLNEAMRIGRRIMVMKDGRVVQCATGPEIIAEPADAYVSDFVSDVDRSRVLTARAVMRPARLTATVHDAPARVLERLDGTGAHGVFVLDDGGRLLGVAGVEALEAAVRAGAADLGGRLTAGEGYHPVPPELPLVDLIPLAGRALVPVPVVDEGRLLGVVPRSAVLSALAHPRSASHA